MGAEDVALPLQAGTKAPLLLLLLHRHLMVLPAPSPGRGLRSRHPKNTGLMKVGSGLLGWEIKISRTG